MVLAKELCSFIKPLPGGAPQASVSLRAQFPTCKGKTRNKSGRCGPRPPSTQLLRQALRTCSGTLPRSHSDTESCLPSCSWPHVAEVLGLRQGIRPRGNSALAEALHL